MLLTKHVDLDDLGGGRFRQTIHARRIGYYDLGVLRRHDNTWQQGNVEFSHLVTLSSIIAGATGDGGRRIYPTRELDRYVELGAPRVKNGSGDWVKVGFSNASRTANTVTWERAEARLKIVHAGHFVKLDLELLGGYVPNGGQFAFPVTLSGLTWTGGTLHREGVPVARVQAPVVYDAASPFDVRPIQWAFHTVGGQTYVLFTLPDLAGMARPVVDPTLVLQPDAADGLDAGMRSDGAASLTLGYVGDTTNLVSNAERFVLAMNYTSIPATATITSGTVELREGGAVGAGDRAVALRQILVDWVEAQVDWTNRKTATAWNTGGCGGDGTDRAASDSASVTLDGTAAADFIPWDVTGDIQKFVDGTWSNYGWLAQAPSIEYQGVAPYIYNQFALSDHATAAWRPKSTVEYTEAGVVIAVASRKRIVYSLSTELVPRRKIGELVKA